MEDYMKEMTKSMTSLQLTMQQSREQQAVFMSRQDVHRDQYHAHRQEDSQWRAQLEDLQWRAQQDTRWELQEAWKAQQKTRWKQQETRWGQQEAYMEQQQAHWNAYYANQQVEKQWRQDMEQRFSSWPNYPPPPPQ